MRTVAFLGVLLAVLMTGVSTTAFILDQYYYEHCRIVAGFAEEDYFVIQWNLTATTIKFGLEQTGNGWLSVGLGNEMLGSDVTQARMFGMTYETRDVNPRNDKGACLGGPGFDGVCADDVKGGTDDVTQVSGTQTPSHTVYQFERPLSPSDVDAGFDKNFTVGTIQSAVYARSSSNDWDQDHNRAGTFDTRWDDEGRADCSVEPADPLPPPGPPSNPGIGLPGGGGGNTLLQNPAAVATGGVVLLSIAAIGAAAGVFLARKRNEEGGADHDVEMLKAPVAAEAEKAATKEDDQADSKAEEEAAAAEEPAAEEPAAGEAAE